MDLPHSIANWKRWLFTKDWLPRQHTTILGLLYICPQRNHHDAPVILPPPIDILDAQLVEDTITQLPDNYHKILIVQYLGQYATGPRLIQRLARTERYRIMELHERTYYRILHRAEDELKNNLQAVKNDAKNGVNQRSVENIHLAV